MYRMLLESHRGLAYLVFLVSLVDVVLVLTKARTDARSASMLRWVHTLGLVWGGRITVLLGLFLFGASIANAIPPYHLGTWWIWVSVLLWAPVEILGKRLGTPEIQAVIEGGAASSRLIAGAFGQLALIVVIFGLMSARP